MNQHGRIYDVAGLNPLFAKPFFHFVDACAKEDLQLRPFETERSPWRQAWLFARGRVKEMPGPRVTDQRAWQGRHQFGIAADMVFWVNNEWTWEEPEKGMWKRMVELAHGAGLVHATDLGLSEMPHVQLKSNRGEIPGGHWSPRMVQWAEQWGPLSRIECGFTHPGAPILPDIHWRPPLLP